ncbi:MAG: hypothetical protein J7L88_00370, partial [Thermoplasmata archaeon]|nr:hypothetical protein [Thermoplasmata archaeon]
MIKKALPIAVLFLVLPIPLSSGDVVERFSTPGGEREEITISLPSGDGEVKGIWINATSPIKIIDSFSLTVETSSGPYPSSIYIDLGDDGQREWGFGGDAYGAFGQQRYFTDSSPSKVLLPGDSSSASLLLPADGRVSEGKVRVYPVPTPGKNVKREFTLPTSSLWSIPLSGGSADMLTLTSRGGKYILTLLEVTNGGLTTRRSYVLPEYCYPMRIVGAESSAMLFSPYVKSGNRSAYFILNGTLKGPFHIRGYPSWAGVCWTSSTWVAVIYTSYPSQIYIISPGGVKRIELRDRIYSPIIVPSSGGTVWALIKSSPLRYLRVSLQTGKVSVVNTTMTSPSLYYPYRLISCPGGLLLYSVSNRTLWKVDVRGDWAEHTPAGRLSGSGTPLRMWCLPPPKDYFPSLLVSWNYARDVTLYLFTEGLKVVPVYHHIPVRFFFYPPKVLWSDRIRIIGAETYSGKVSEVGANLNAFCRISTPSGSLNVRGPIEVPLPEWSRFRETGKAVEDRWGNRFKEFCLPFRVEEGVAVIGNMEVNYSLAVSISTEGNSSLLNYLSALMGEGRGSLE